MRDDQPDAVLPSEAAPVAVDRLDAVVVQAGIEAKVDRLSRGLIPGVGPTRQRARVFPYVLLGVALTRPEPESSCISRA